MNITGKIAVVAGGSAGIGRGAARALVDAGAKHVVLLARGVERLETASAELRTENTTITSYAVDLGKYEQVQAVADQICAEVGVPHILVHSAGAGTLGGLLETDVGAITTHVESTCYAGYFLTKALLPRMLEQGEGHIVFVGSPLIHVNLPMSAYLGSRSAVRGIAQALHYELSRTRIGVSYVEPTLVYDTDYFEAHQGSLNRFPALARSSAFRVMHQTSDSAGQLIIRAIQRNRRYAGHWASWMLRVTPFLRPLYEWSFKLTSLPPDQGGPNLPT